MIRVTLFLRMARWCPMRVFIIMRESLYILACLIIPALWGLAVSWVYVRIAARRAANHPPDQEKGDMFYI